MVAALLKVIPIALLGMSHESLDLWRNTLVGSREAMRPRPSQLDPYVPVSVHTAPDVLSFRFCSCGRIDGSC